jgi:DNA repair exonuclease SbcCD nuclease subunit
MKPAAEGLPRPRYAIINDQHFGVNGDSEFFMANYAKFYREIFFPELVAYDIKTLLIPGDLWQSRKSINPLTLSFTQREFFDKLLALDIKVYIAYGNHDVYYKNTNTTNSIDFIGNMYANVTVVREFIDLPGDVMLMSWIAPDTQEAMFARMEETTARYLIGHFEIVGHEMTPGYPCEHGLSQAMFTKFDKVISGHFHVRGNDGKIFYTSNPSQTTWADFNQPKGFHIFDTADGSLTPVDNPHEVYAVLHYEDGSKADDVVVTQVVDKIVKVIVESYASVNLPALKEYVNIIAGVAHKVVVVETAKFEGTSDLEVGGDVEAMSLRSVMVDYVTEEAPEAVREPCKVTMADLYDRATGVST